ncbi:MAG: hypothetical protein AAF726_15040 [Planctomycetota bacterium]
MSRSSRPGSRSFSRGNYAIAIALIGTPLAGCALFEGDAGEIGRPTSTRVALTDEWTAAILDMGRYPIVPPTEDLYVGDIFALSSESGNGSVRTAEGLRSLATPRWKSLDVLPLLDAEYRRRPTWQPAGGKDESLYSGEESPRRQRLVGIRSLANITVDVPELEPYLPIEVAPLIEGPATPDRLGVSIHVGEAEMYSLSVATILDQLVERLDESASAPFVLKEEHRTNLSLAADPATGLVYFYVITEVLYIRSIEATVRSREDTLAKSPQSWSLRSDADDLLEGPALVPGPNLGEDKDHALAAIQRAAAMNEALTVNGIEDRTVGAIKMVMATDEALTMRRTWPHPLAAAVRGITLEVESATGVVRRMGPIGVPLIDPPAPEEEDDADDPR